MRALKNGYTCQQDWPDDCFVQGDTSGLVLSRKRGSYTTAFFEAFPAEPNNAFIRGEGETLVEAEQKAFADFTRYRNCAQHDFERVDAEGAGRCRHCQMESRRALPSEHSCAECGQGDAVKRVKANDGGQILCIKCYATTYSERQLADAVLDADSREAAAETASQLEDLSMTQALYEKYAQDPAFMALKGADQEARMDRIKHLAWSRGDIVKRGLVEILLTQDGEAGAEFLDEAQAAQLMTHPVVAAHWVDYLLALEAQQRKVNSAVEAAPSGMTHQDHSRVLLTILLGLVSEARAAYQPEQGARTRMKTHSEHEASMKNALTSLFEALGGGADETTEPSI